MTPADVDPKHKPPKVRNIRGGMPLLIGGVCLAVLLLIISEILVNVFR